MFRVCQTALVTFWERVDLLVLLYVMYFFVFCHFSVWCPGSGVVLDCQIASRGRYVLPFMKYITCNKQWLANIVFSAFCCLVLSIAHFCITLHWLEQLVCIVWHEPVHEISNNLVCATSKGSDQPAHTRRLIRAFACRLNILWLFSYWLNILWSF